MYLLTEEEYYKYYYKYGKCKDQMSKPKNKLNDKQLLTKYLNYVKKEERKKEKRTTKIKEKTDGNSDWIVCRKKVYARDNEKCIVDQILTVEERNILKQSGSYIKKDISPAHYIRRSKSKAMECVVENVYTIYWSFHFRLDMHLSPITGKYITDEELDEWWYRVITFVYDEEMYEWLQEQKNRRIY